MARARPVAVLLVALALAACSGSDDPEPRAAPPASVTTTAVPAAAPVCAGGTLGPRSYVLCTAGDAPGQGLIVALHGRRSSAAEMQAMTGLEVPAAAAGYAVVYPDGLDGGWGDDTFPTPSRPEGDEDVVFLDSLVAALHADPRIGDGPVGVVGFSNGASMALRYAAQRPDAVRAVVSVAGQLPRDPAVRPTGRVPLLALYGDADPIRSFAAGIADSPARAPGGPTPTLPTLDTAAAFAGPDARQAAPEQSDPDPSDGTKVQTERWSDGDGTRVVLQVLVGGGHTWPSAHTPPSPDFGTVSHDLDASAEAVTFVTDLDL
ncbi:MAG TPA: alpha/beta fold hydrolase [Acidimicrobiales bacterium]|jgi:polyhydroxybutyrate depolymerase